MENREFQKSHQALTMAQLVGKIMSWLFGIPCLLLMCFVIGHHFGWWV